MELGKVVVVVVYIVLKNIGSGYMFIVIVYFVG